ncbi:MAG: endopeptidase La [Clostridia bacterium]|nr:endopeptidase La [Clostridia bacterium]
MAEEENKYLPLVALRGRVALPYVTISFDAGRLTTLTALKCALDRGKQLIAVTQRDEKKEQVSADDLYSVGTVFSIARVTNLPANRVRVTGKGLYRVKIKNITSEDNCLYAYGEKAPEIADEPELEEAYFRSAKYAMGEILDSPSNRLISEDISNVLKNGEDKEEFVYTAANTIKLSVEKKQHLLEADKLSVKFDILYRYLNDELEISKLEKKISATVKRNIEKGQKDFYLREQLKAIHSELGDDENEKIELEEKIKAKGMPEEVEEKALKELSRMSRMSTSSPDYNVLHNYIDWLLDLEWNFSTTDTENLADAVKVLNDDHYGLEKIKERITEYLAVLKLTGGMNAPILCFVGPPGVGKTSIATSVARALGRKFVRMSLGGVRDEAEIRGHRKTYVGAMPGRVINAIKNAGSVNPVFLLDEIDKLSSDSVHGDPSSALLEVLDPAQNSTFRDRYLEVPYDLSKVLFITTANDLSTIPAPLLDRMEIIRLSGYTQEEKREIAKRYLIPKKLAANGLSDCGVSFDDDAIDRICDGYTREAGVRELERQIDAVCRKIAVKKAEGKRIKKTVTAEAVEEYLGAERFARGDEMPKGDLVGAACGLAWTAVGGTTLTIEVSAMHGKGDILLTGKLGDVMKESARAAISYIRSNAESFGLSDEQFSNTDIHVHVPEGATPKDGPSAGITMATAILSAFTKKPVRRDVAMTGEITLRGRVLPIGGLKEKSLAAYRIGVREVIIPQDNLKDLEDVPEVVKENVRFIPVESVGDVFKNAIIGI